MKFDEIVSFLKDNWPIILAVIVIVTPIVWKIIDSLYKNRLEEFQARRRVKSSSANPLAIESSLASDDPNHSSLLTLYPHTNPDSESDLKDRIVHCQKRITIFGLTRNFYATESMRSLFIKKSLDIPIVLFLMNPQCSSRQDRYRLEPIEAALEDPGRFSREVVAPFHELMSQTKRTIPGSNLPGISLYYYNFPCSFAIEEFDDVLRVMLYGHGKRGTEGPIFTFGSSNPYGEYFSSQLRWLEKLATLKHYSPWTEKGLKVVSLE